MLESNPCGPPSQLVLSLRPSWVPQGHLWPHLPPAFSASALISGVSGTWRRTPNFDVSTRREAIPPQACLVVSTTHWEQRERTRASYARLRSCYQATRRPCLGGGCGYRRSRSWGIYPKRCLSYSLRGADAGIPPTLPSTTTTKPTRIF